MKPRILLRRSLLGGVFFCLLPVSADGAILYGDFSDVPPGGVMYTDVTESSNSPGDNEPLFGPPTIAGNRMDFDPKGFSSTAVSGATDITDGQLNFTLSSIPSHSLEFLTLNGRGDATLFGSGAASRIGYALSIGSITVLEVDGSPLDKPVPLDPLSQSRVMTITDNPGQLMSWNLGLLYEVDAALSAASVPYVYGATKLELSIDSSFSTIGEASAIAFIAQKDFVLDAQTEEFSLSPRNVAVPEPSLLLPLGLAVTVLRRRRRA